MQDVSFYKIISAPNNAWFLRFVCAVPAKHINRQPRLFRTWSADKSPGYNCTIWEAARATSAAPTFFKRISIGDAGLQEEFIDAGIGCNNPVRYLVEEAGKEFGPERTVSCIVSIGTGKPMVAGFKSPGLFQRVLPLDLIKVLASMATDSETEASTMKARFQNCSGLYHRLNVERGLEEVSLEEWEKLGEVKSHTMAYLSDSTVSQGIDVIVDALVGKSSKTFPLGQLGI
jgi:predicted acylesterase/phospholipase RssA